MQLSIYTYAKNCKNISEIQEGISEMYKYIEKKELRINLYHILTIID